jgi:hypothetical protein
MYLSGLLRTAERDGHCIVPSGVCGPDGLAEFL